jgi:hypothetical protein
MLPFARAIGRGWWDSGGCCRGAVPRFHRRGLSRSRCGASGGYRQKRLCIAGHPLRRLTCRWNDHRQDSGVVEKAGTRHWRAGQLSQAPHSLTQSRKQRLGASAVNSFNDPADPGSITVSVPGTDNIYEFTGWPLCRSCQGAFSGAGAGVVGAGAGAAAGCFSGAAGAGAGAGFFSGAAAGGFVAAFGVGCCFLQPLNVNATKARTANAVRTTFLMVNPFRKTISQNTPLQLRRAKTLGAP